MQKSNYSGQGRRGREMGRGVPLHSQLYGIWGSVVSRKLPQLGLGRSPAANDFGAFRAQFYAILRIF